MSDDSPSDSLELKKRARRRLVGAAALALLAAVVLPLVMDSEPKSGNQEIQIHIPSKEGAAANPATIPVPASPLPSPREAEKPGPAADSLAPEPKPAAQDKPADTPAKSKTEPTAPAKPDAAKPEPVKKTDAARAEAILDGRDASVQWIVQLGAYQNAGNVKQLTTKLKEGGLPVYTEKFDSPQGPRTRVRAGPFATREAAEKARDRIKKLGVDGQVAQK